MALQTPETKGWQRSAKGVDKGVNCRVSMESVVMPDFRRKDGGFDDRWVSKIGKVVLQEEEK